MNEYDCVEVIVEKEKYIREGVHKGMQGWICFEQCTPGYWLVNFPQYGDNDDIATISIKEEDLNIIPVMDARINERIKEQFESTEKSAKAMPKDPEDLSGYLI